jgi:hypothetical protein
MDYVNLVLYVILAGSVASFLVIPPLIDKIDRTGKVGILGF